MRVERLDFSRVGGLEEELFGVTGAWVQGELSNPYHFSDFKDCFTQTVLFFVLFLIS